MRADGTRDMGWDGAADLGADAADFGVADADDLRCLTATGDQIPATFCHTTAECSSWQTCQHGRCCGGTLDPTTCVCNCPAIGVDASTPCEFMGQSCCVNDPSWPAAPAPGALACRPGIQCTPSGP